MIRALLRLIVVLTLLLGALSSAQAFRPICLGKVEYIHRIADTGLRDSSGNRLALARKQTTSCFLVPYRTVSNGFVLMSERDHAVYYPMPSGEELHSDQWRGLLPDPLPDDGLPLIDFFFGHLMWAIFFFAGVVLRDPLAALARAIRKSRGRGS